MTKIIRTSPAGEPQQALQDFENLAATLGPLRKGTDTRHVLRLLAAAHDPGARDLLRFLDESAIAWPSIVKKLNQQTSEAQFRQTLTELRLLSHLNKQNGTHAQPAGTPKNSKHHDIDAAAAGVVAKIEIYSPSDCIGPPLFDQHISSLFKFLEVSAGFHLDLILESPATVKVGTASQIERWLTRIRAEAETWINASAAVGASKSWDGPNKSTRLTVTIRKISGNRADRVVRYMDGKRSTDSRILFDQGDHRQLRLSSWEKKVFDKMRDRQCGEYEQGKVRLLIIDFSGLDTSSRDFFRTTCMEIFSRIESALRIAAADAGGPIPYDGVVLAWVGDPIVFAPAIALHPRASADLQKFISAATLTGNLVESVERRFLGHDLHIPR